MGTHLSQAVGEAESCDAYGFRHPDVTVGAEKTFDAGCDGESILFNFANSLAKLGRQMRSHGDELQVYFGMAREIVQRPVKMTVVGARTGDDRNAPLHLMSHGNAGWLEQT